MPSGKVTLGRNPCELVDPPSWKGKTMRTLTPGEVGILLETAEGNYFYPVIYTAVITGLRQAELLGLRWRDIDLEYAARYQSARCYTSAVASASSKSPRLSTAAAV